MCFLLAVVRSETHHTHMPSSKPVFGTVLKGMCMEARRRLMGEMIGWSWRLAHSGSQAGRGTGLGGRSPIYQSWDRGKTPGRIRGLAPPHRWHVS